MLDGNIVTKVLTFRLKSFDLVADEADEFVVEKYLREAEFLLAIRDESVLVLKALTNVGLAFLLLKTGEVDRSHAFRQLHLGDCLSRHDHVLIDVIRLQHDGRLAFFVHRLRHLMGLGA